MLAKGRSRRLIDLCVTRRKKVLSCIIWPRASKLTKSYSVKLLLSGAGNKSYREDSNLRWTLGVPERQLRTYQPNGRCLLEVKDFVDLPSINGVSRWRKLLSGHDD